MNKIDMSLTPLTLFLQQIYYKYIGILLCLQYLRVNLWICELSPDFLSQIYLQYSWLFGLSFLTNTYNTLDIENVLGEFYSHHKALKCQNNT